MSKNKNIKYDKKTKALIKKLAYKYKKNELSDIDISFLKKLKDGEIDYNQIKKEKEKCREDVFYFINE